MEKRSIVFYDGECGFCQSIVQIILSNDESSSIYFASIQSDFTTSFFKSINEPIPDLSTFYFFHKGQLYSKSNAALNVARLLKFPFPLVYFFIIVPRFLRDFCYDIIARNRLKLASNSCRIPTVEEKNRFIS